MQSNLTALRISSEVNTIDARYSGFESLLATQWQTLPAGVGALVGEPFKLNERPRDEITWVCSAGPGLMTRYAAGEYRVSLRLRPIENGSEHMEIGLARRPKTDELNANERESWIPLLPNVQSLQIRYFDPRLNTWVDRWTDTVTLPRLVKVAIARKTARRRGSRSSRWGGRRSNESAKRRQEAACGSGVDALDVGAVPPQRDGRSRGRSTSARDLTLNSMPAAWSKPRRWRRRVATSPCIQPCGRARRSCAEAFSRTQTFRGAHHGRRRTLEPELGRGGRKSRAHRTAAQFSRAQRDRPE